MHKANLGCGTIILDGWDNVDLGFSDNFLDNPSWTIKLDVDTYLENLPDNWLDEIRAHHILEHLPDLDHTMAEIARSCKQRARIDIIVPVANTLWAVADPTHCRLFNHKTFEYYCDGFQTSYGRPRDFRMISQHIERYPNEWFEGIEWIVANLHVILERL